MWQFYHITSPNYAFLPKYNVARGRNILPCILVDEQDDVEKELEEVKEDVVDEDSLNIMVGDEDNLFDEEEKPNGVPASPPRPETVPAKHPFTSKDTISLSSRSEKPPSENSSMRVNPDESQSVASHDSNDGTKDVSLSNAKVNGAEKAEVTNATENKIRNLWVSGLSSSTKAAELKSIFSEHGKVSGAKIVTNSRTVGARCFGYLTMATPEDAEKCVEKLNKTEIGGNLIVVEKATPDAGPHRQEKKEDLKRSRDVATPRDNGKRDDRPKTAGAPRRSHETHASRGSSSGGRHDDRRHDLASNSHRHSAGGGRRDGHYQNQHGRGGGVLTFSHIKDQRKKEQERDEERRRRERERRRQEDDDRRRKEALRRQKDEEDKLRREREELKREREKLEREKLELMKFERERQRMERDKLEREKVELERLRRQQMSGRDNDDRRGSKRPAENRDAYVDRKRIGQREEFSSGNRGMCH